MDTKLPGRIGRDQLTNDAAVLAGVLEAIRRARAQVGDELEDEEFTQFLIRQSAPEGGRFGFVCFHNGCATLTVPPQEEAAWHPAAGWISPAKEKLGGELARKHGLNLAEPPDAPAIILMPGAGESHHHLQFANRQETIIVAHPRFLKIRLYASKSKVPLRFTPELIQDLSALYATGKEINSGKDRAS